MRLRDRTIVAGVSVIVVVLLALFLSGTVNLTVHLPTVTNQVATTTTSQTGSHFVLAELGESRWVRGANDTPEYTTGVNWLVCNDGQLVANNASVLVRSDGAIVYYESFPLPAHNCHDGKADLRYPYETANHVITIEAFSHGSEANKSLSISVALPRPLLEPGTTPSPGSLESVRVLITPNDPVMIDILRRVFEETGIPGLAGLQGWTMAKLCPDQTWAGGGCTADMVLGGIQGWVGRHIALRQGLGPVQLPRQTLQSGIGDSTDRDILIVSLARAAGIGGIFVVVSPCGTWVYVTSNPFHYADDRYRYCTGESACTPPVYYFNDEVAALACAT